MDLKEWEKKYDQVIENQIEQFIEEKSNELCVPDPLRPKEYQLANYKNQLSELIHSKSTDDVINQALTLICNRMPQTVSNEIWESVSENFSRCEEKLELFLETDEQNKNSGDVYIPIYEMCGISLQTLEHCYAFGQSLYDKKEFANSKSIMLFLMKIASEIPEFWISAAMCDKQMGNYDSAINIYKLAEAAFPDNPSLYLYCADNCIATGDKTNAKIQLEAAKSVFSLNADVAAQWQPTYEYLLAKAA